MTIYDNFSEFAARHQELAEHFLDVKERGYFKYYEGEELPNNWKEQAIYYYEDKQEYAEYYRNECTCIAPTRIYNFDCHNGEVIEIA